MLQQHDIAVKERQHGISPTYVAACVGLRQQHNNGIRSSNITVMQASIQHEKVPAASPLAGKRRGPESMSDAESSGTREDPTADSLDLVPLTPDDSHALSSRSLDHIMQYHRQSL